MRLLNDYVLTGSLLAVALLNSNAARSEALPAVKLHGPPQTLQFVGVSETGTPQFQTADGSSVAIPADQLAWWGRLLEFPDRSHVVLRNGDVLHGTSFLVDSATLRFTSSILGPVELPLNQVAGIVLQGSRVHGAPDQRLRLLLGDQESDQAWLLSGDKISGKLIRQTADAVFLRAAWGELELGREKVAALSLASRMRGDPAKDARWLAGLRDGSRITMSEIESRDSALYLRDVRGLEFSVDVDAIGYLQPRGDAVDYLSDRPVGGYRHVPYLSGAWPFHLDRAAEGGMLRCNGQLHLKGIGMHSASRLIFQLREGDQELITWAGMDDTARGGGSAAFQVFGDAGGMAWRALTERVILRGDDAPRRIHADLSGMRRVSLVVDYADEGDILDRTNWLNPRLR